MTRGADPASARFYFLQGFFATLVVLYPFFGRAFTVFGYHNRVVSSVVLVIVILASLTRFSLNRARNGLLVVTLSLLVLAFLYAEPVQRAQILYVRFETDYYEGKLARLFQISLPVFVLGYVVSSSRHRTSFVRGTWWAVFVSGLIGLGVLAVHREYFLGQTYRTVHTFAEEGLFSAIGLSVVLSLAMILILDMIPWKGSGFIWLPFLSLAHFFSVLLLRQRAHLIMLSLLALAKFWGKRTKIVSAVAVAVVFGLGVAMVMRNYRELVATETVRSYWRSAAEGRMVRTRTELAASAIAGIREDPMGHGLGAYSLHHEKPYPHNRFLEAFYELGIPGAFCVGWICVLALGSLRGLFVSQENSKASPSVWFLRAIVVLLLAHELKSGSLENISTLVYFLFIAPPVRPLPRRSGELVLSSHARWPSLRARIT